ncbi:putative hemolysin-III channel protein Izh2 [Dissophora ornata]|nr:hypothetical protein BGZ58_001394 [Dissophora ornata]KAI8597137.1 putative hemolysin-III channel protein Izh2 [Dissophora ornata]
MSSSSSTSSSTTTAHTIQQSHQDAKGSTGIFTIRPAGSQDSGAGAGTSVADSASAHSSQYGSVKDSDNLGPICTWDELPDWMHDNPAIWTGYRRPTFSYKKCLASLGFLHNESVNIWTHLLGAIVCIVGSPLAYFKIFGVLETIRWTDVAVFYIFMGGAIICLSMSASFHTFSCHSETVSHQWNRCDYVGIVFLIAGSFYPAIFYGFYCFKVWQITYISLITVFGAATVVTVIRPKFRTPQYRWVRSCMFLAMGLSAVFPVIHSLFLYGLDLAHRAISLNYMVCMGAAYVFGALLYGSRTPERLFPGKFDHFGASHQIFHVCVLIGVTIHFLGVTKAMAFWHDTNHSCAIPINEMRAQY